MPDAMAFPVRHRYVILCVTVLTEQVGLPVPSVPFLVAAGALAEFAPVESSGGDRFGG
jgi:hypothetical protein